MHDYDFNIHFLCSTFTYLIQFEFVTDMISPPLLPPPRYCGGAVLWYYAVVLHLHQPVPGVKEENQGGL